jgi:hypothetical protein
VQKAFLEAEVRCPRSLPRFVVYAPIAWVCFKPTAKISSSG